MDWKNIMHLPGEITHGSLQRKVYSAIFFSLEVNGNIYQPIDMNVLYRPIY
jgi:hypothetical protein